MCSGRGVIHSCLLVAFDGEQRAHSDFFRMALDSKTPNPSFHQTCAVSRAGLEIRR
mgnify:CR=1 FL=1